MRRLAVLGLASVLAVTPVMARAEGIDLGTLMGAGLGALVGNQIGKGTGKIAATAVGAFTGGVIGHHVDRSWDDDRGRRYSSSSYSSTYYEPRQTVTYVPNYVAPPAPTVVYEQPYYAGGYDYDYGRRHRRHYRRDVIVQQVYTPPPVIQQAAYEQDEEAGYCREYTQRVQVGGRVQESYGTACQQPDGSWKIVK